MSAHRFTHAWRRRRAKQDGLSLLELMAYVSIGSTFMVLLGGGVVHLLQASRAALQRTLVQTDARNILRRITDEVLLTSTVRDHAEPVGLALPLDDSTAAGTISEAYNFPATAIEVLHNTLTRDGVEFFHAPTTERRFYIYATYEEFDTLEFQVVRWTAGVPAAAGGEVPVPWSAPRKIFLENGQVLMRVQGAVPQTIVLGNNVQDLSFHLSGSGELLIRVVTASDRQPITVENRLILRPRNGLG